MFKQRRKPNVSVAIGTGICVLVLGISLPVIIWNGVGMFQNELKQVDVQDPKSEVLPLAQLSPEKRASKLEALAQEPKSQDRSRARYLLASDLIGQQQGTEALKWLEGLENDYPLLAGHIAVQRARAYEVAGDAGKAEEAWQEVLKRHGKEPVAAEALFALGQKDGKYWDRAIEEFPKHPRSVEIASLRLQKKPNQQEMLMVLAKHGLYHPDIISVLDRLDTKFGEKLTEEEWEAVAFGYWEKQVYGKAGAAYAKATRTPRNAYRAGRGLQLGEKQDSAESAYKKLLREYPAAEETATGLLRLQELVSPKQAIDYLDAVVKRFPEKAPEALLEKAKVLDSRKNAKAAEQVRKTLLSEHSKSNAAAKLRWTQAQQRAAVTDVQRAWQLAQQIITENPDSEQAPEAAFWAGKWGKILGKDAEVKQAFEWVLAKYPESYYAWRAAVLLGWDVGDFTTVRDRTPLVLQPEVLPNLPTGSEVLKELYQLGQGVDAWRLWHVEFKTPMEPTVAEQFTDGLMRLAVGDNLEALFMIGSLDQRDKPEEKLQYETLKQERAYWHALYPFPFLDSIVNWSEARKLNSLLVTGLIRQESRFMPAIKSGVGAVGLMQVMPETGAEVAKTFGVKQYKLDNPDDNIQLGTGYLDFTHREYKNNSLLAVASYNAGPSNVADWIAKYGFSDPDIFVEKIPFEETQTYVKSVFGNYWNYLRLYNPELSQRLAEHSEAMQTTSKK
ncbi:transglycosylase SLT domain-containing protein [Microcoleus sp. FACHB-68]|uniref:lytic transglycosylase domain-containing protein n=1 Tax=Microcoleus sp. FACHB-68 TaxID=2692826 RepID=UPI0016857D50|nr:transglycosylase SLT domain-containing protein [Microcoleus sp. FACHB-68]MBD1938343.1 transglycosylase SLT domain-containing protein [Microcoleus sp. FACHB-68]